MSSICTVSTDLENGSENVDVKSTEDDSLFKVPAPKSPAGINSSDKESILKSYPKGPERPVSDEPDKLLSLSELKSRALSRMSPAELLKEQTPSGVSYREPLWSSLLSEQYWVEVIKNGVVLEKFVLDKPMASVGRSKHVDIVMEHPSISRIHAVFQMRGSCGTSGDEQPGIYLFDTGSTHGTFVNKNRIEANCYNRLKVGHVIKFGTSTRLFILHGPETDAPAVSAHSITEIKAINAEILRKRAEIIEERKKQAEQEVSDGVSWGFKEDAVESDEEEEERPGSVNPFSLPEELDLEDPKKTLKGCFEREGYEVEYVCEDQGFGNHMCRIELPMVDNDDGTPVFAEVINKGKRKEIMIQCALEACRILDAHGILRASTHERKEVKKRNWAENDYYDSDEDTYLDRTGDVEAKRKKRMEKFGVAAPSQTVHTFESLSADLLAAQEELSRLEHEIESSKDHISKMNSLDTLEQYMQGVKSGGEMDANTRRKLKIKMIELKKEIAKLSKMKEAARPSEIKLKSTGSGSDSSKTDLNAARSKFAMKFGVGGLKKRVNDSTSQKVGGTLSTDEGVNPLWRGSTSPSVSGTPQRAEIVIKTNSDGTEYESDDEETSINTRIPPKAVKLNEPPSLKSSSLDPHLSSCSAPVTTICIDEPDKTPSKKESGIPPQCTSASNSSTSASGNHQYPKAFAKATVGPEKHIDVGSVATDTVHTSGKQKRQLKAKKTESISVEENSEMSANKLSLNQSTGMDGLEESDSFAGWVPPTDQKGDGKTKLNDMLGY